MSPEEIMQMAIEMIDLPEGAVATHGILLMEYLDPGDGKELVGWQIVGDPGIAQTTALIETGKFLLLMDTFYPDVTGIE